MVRIAQVETIPSQAGAGAAPAGAGRAHGSPGAAVAAAPALVAIVLLVIAAWSDGAFPLRSWGPLAVFALVALAAGRRNGVRGAAVAAVACFWGYALLTLVSAAWSDSPGRALEGAARTFLYAGLVTLPVLTLPDRTWAVRTARFIACGMAALVLASLAAATVEGTGWFLAGRLDDPVGYRNGTAALFAMAFWPLVCEAAERRVHALVRAAGFALGVGALGLALLTQSRGVLLGFACGAAAALALGPNRLRRAWLAIVAVSAVAIAADPLQAPYRGFVDTSRTSPEAVDRALAALGNLAIAGFAAALVLALFDGGLRVSARRDRQIRALAAAALAVLALGGGVGAVAVAGNPISFAADKAREFRSLDVAAPGESRLGSAGGQRYDLWRIAWQEFRSAPVAGVGEGAYPGRYYQRRATDRNLTDPHSLPLRVLAETGLLGVLLLGGALAAAIAALARGWPSAGPAERRWASAMVAASAVLIGQSTVDWLWLIPGLTGLGLACLAVALAIVALPSGDAAPAPRRRRWSATRRLLPALAAALVGVVCVSDVYTRTARAADASPEEKLRAARVAERLDPWALAPRYLQAGALEELGRRAEARRELLAALDIEPHSFVTLGLLGDLETRAGNRAAAREYYRRALALNPRDTGLRQLAR